MGNGNKVEMLIAVCAVVTSMIAIFVAWDQGRVMRAQQHGAVYPVLQVDGYGRNTATHTAVGIDIRNSGVGPALIESVTLSVGDGDAEGMLDYLQTLPAGYELSWSGLTGRALAPGETVTPIDLRWATDTFDVMQMARVSEDSQNWSLEICYCSVFGRCWQTRQIGRSRATLVDACPRGEIDIFEQLGAQNVPLQDMPANDIAQPAEEINQ